jgi:hypothetical protein
VEKTNRLLAAALAAAALLTEAACSDDAQPIDCRVVDAHARSTRIVRVNAGATCPPAATQRTIAHPATASVAGWYYHGGVPSYGTLPRGAAPATQAQAQDLEYGEMAAEREARNENALGEARARAAAEGEDFGRSGARWGGFGG